MTQLTLSSPTDRTVAQPARPGPDTAAAATMRILVVGDEDTLRESCASVLSHDGYNVTMTGVAREAHALLRHNVFDVLLLDGSWGKIPGCELLALALSANPPTRVIAVTGKATLAPRDLAHVPIEQ